MINDSYEYGFQNELEKIALHEPTDAEIVAWQNPTAKIPLYKPPKTSGSSSSSSTSASSSSSASGFGKVANVVTGDGREIDTGLMGSYMMAPMVGTAAFKGVHPEKVFNLNKDWVESTVKRGYGKTMFGPDRVKFFDKINKTKFGKALVMGALGLAGGAYVGAPIGRATENFLVKKHEPK